MFGIPFLIDLPTFESYLITHYIDYINLNDMMVYYLLFQIIAVLFYAVVFSFLYKIFLRMWKWFF